MKAICIVIGLLFLLAMVYEKNSIEIKGTVVDAEERIPLKDCHVFVKGTHIGVTSDDEGAFTLNVPLIYKNKSLIASYVGYSNFEEDIAQLQEQEIQIDMQPAIVALDEVLEMPVKGLLIDQAIDNALTEYNKSDEMLMDFYLALLTMDEDHHVWEKVNASMVKNN